MSDDSEETAAFTVWEARVAPVFDTARRVLLVRAGSGTISARSEEVLPDGLPVDKALRLRELGARTLVCGAIARPTYELLCGYGIRVVPFVAGELECVVDAWLAGTLGRPAFAMPGCPGPGRHRFGGPGGRRGTVAGASCICPRCGRTESHEPGVPCVERACPQCGSMMMRR